MRHSIKERPLYSGIGWRWQMSRISRPNSHFRQSDFLTDVSLGLRRTFFLGALIATFDKPDGHLASVQPLSSGLPRSTDQYFRLIDSSLLFWSNTQLCLAPERIETTNRQFSGQTERQKTGVDTHSDDWPSVAIVGGLLFTGQNRILDRRSPGTF